MHARVLSIRSRRAGDQQKDNLCGPFWAARVLNESGHSTWGGKPIDEDLIALRAGTVLPSAHDGADVPPGAVSQSTYRYALPTAPIEQSGTSAGALAEVIEAASAGELRCVPMRGAWNAERVERLVAGAHGVGSRLIANVRTGRLWGSRPPVEIQMLVRGPQRSLVVVHDSYPSLGLDGRHLQPPRAVAAALLRGDGREGGVLAVVPPSRVEAARALATEIGLEIRIWNNGTGS